MALKIPEIFDEMAHIKAVERERKFTEKENGTVLATVAYTREYAERFLDEKCGRYLVDVLDGLIDEVSAEIIRTPTRENSLVVTKLQEARHWAIERGVKQGSHFIFDRRRFQQQEETQDES